VRNLQEINDSFTGHAFNDYSQWGEDGVLAEIFNRIGTENKWCLECGAADGLFFSNTRTMIEQGWDAVLIESDPDTYERLTRNCSPFGGVKCWNAAVDRANTLDNILAANGAPADIDLVSIDIDGQDFYALNAMLRFKPRVVVIEYGQGDPDFLPTLGGEGQAGLHKITALAVGKCYVPVWRSATNLIFVKRPLEEKL
jgi:hypothetical protein